MVPETALDYTGQRRDGTGLLFYNARYYDPVLGKFLSPDTIVPGLAEGKGGSADSLGPSESAALTPLTVDFHEPRFVSGLNEENAFTQEKGFWFQLGDEDREQAKSGLGPANPQALNRYAYVLNNPVRYTDPDGHCGPVCIRLIEAIGRLIQRHGPQVVSWVSRMAQRLTSASRVIEHATGARLDTSRISIPGPVNSPGGWGKLDFLLGRVTAGDNAATSAARAEFFVKTMGYSDETLDAALRTHLVENFKDAILQANGRFLIRGMTVGPNGVSSMMTSIWQVLEDGTFALVTAW